MSMKRYFAGNPWLIPFAVGLLLRLGLALPGMLAGDWGRFCRPDSYGYLVPAHGLLQYGTFSADGVPTAVRAPGFSWFAAAVLKLSGGNWENFSDFASAEPGILCVVLVIFNALMILLCFLAAQELFGRRAGIVAAYLAALNPTAIAQGPMMLSDTLFGFAAAVQFYLLVLGWKRKSLLCFVGGICAAAAGALIRPINSVWILPGLVLLGFLPEIPWKRKLKAGVLAAACWCIILFPWMFRNSSIGAGFCIDTNTGSMYHQNGAVLLAAVNKTDYESEKQKILKTLEQEFQDKEKYPTIAHQSRYRKEAYKKLIMQYPFRWFFQQFQWKVCLPDLPTVFELLGLTKSDRGTFNVLRTQGLYAAVNHYFDGKLHLPLLALPLLLAHGILLAGALYTLILLLKKPVENIFLILLFLAMAEYYIFLPGSITMPRYLLPALPLLAAFAGQAVNRFANANTDPRKCE